MKAENRSSLDPVMEVWRCGDVVDWSAVEKADAALEFVDKMSGWLTGSAVWVGCPVAWTLGTLQIMQIRDEALQSWLQLHPAAGPAGLVSTLALMMIPWVWKTSTVSHANDIRGEQKSKWVNALDDQHISFNEYDLKLESLRKSGYAKMEHKLWNARLSMRLKGSEGRPWVSKFNGLCMKWAAALGQTKKQNQETRASRQAVETVSLSLFAKRFAQSECQAIETMMGSSTSESTKKSSLKPPRL